MTLAELIAVRQETIIRRFVTLAASGRRTPPVGRSQLIDALPAFLRELVVGLERAEGRGGACAHDEIPAREHGRQRHQLGFDLQSVVEEYGSLFESILAMVCEEDVQLTNGDVSELTRAHQIGVEEAVREYLACARGAAPLTTLQ